MTRRKKSTQRSQAKAQRKATALERLQAGVKALVDSDRWVTYLRAAARFHRYSFGNVMLILAQCPDASRVAGYRKWQEMGRQVRRGEEGIAVFGHPKPRYTKRENQETGETEKVTTSGVFFPICYVFDVAQTNGDPLPTVTEKMTGDTPLIENMTNAAGALGLEMAFEMMTEAKGGYIDKTTNHIGINDTNDQAHQCRTIAHELGHYLLEHTTDRASISRDQAELEAESVAYIVAEHLGLSPDSYSFGYLAVWSQGQPDDVAKIISESGARISKAAKAIIEALEQGMPARTALAV